MSFILIITLFSSFLSFGAEYCSSATEPRSTVACGSCPMVKINCDFQATKDFPRILLVGETHNDEVSTATRNRLLDLALKGLFPVGSETTDRGPFFPWYKSEGQNLADTRLHGIESHEPYAVTLSYLMQNEFVLGDQPRRSEKLRTKLIDYISTLPLFRDGFTKMKGLPSLKGKSTQEIRGKVVEALAHENIETFARDLHLAILELANDPQGPIRCLLGNRSLRPLLTPEDRKVVGLLKPQRENDEENTEEVLIDDAYHSYDVFRVFYSIRNREFARQATELACRYAGKYTGVVINLGERHVSRETAHWLIELSEGRIQTADIFDPRNFKDKKELYGLLREIGPIGP